MYATTVTLTSAMPCSPTLWRSPQNSSLRSELTVEYTHYRYVYEGDDINSFNVLNCTMYICVYIFFKAAHDKGH